MAERRFGLRRCAATTAASLVLVSWTMTPAAAAQDGVADDPVPGVVATYRTRIPELMVEQGIPGLAVALVDTDRVLWVEGFGHVDGPSSAPVTEDTMFGVQSMSKLFTATAVLQAVAAGRLDLDEPITTYLPDFTVHSAFEEHPERRITLRMLLGHTAGFTHEAPVGNNNELDPGAFDTHVRSISDTWLRFPVGSGYAYSNLGIDLAGYILERVEGRPFADVVRDSLLAPLRMERSTFDRETIRATSDRAIGHVAPYPEPPLDVPMTAAGGLYTSAADLARFLRFQLADGSLDGRVVLDPEWMEEMRTVPPPRAGEPAGYALGVVRHRWNQWGGRPDLFDHGGGGFGFLADLWWSPPLGLGVAILTNSQDHELQGDLALAILTDLVSEPGVYHDRLDALPPRPVVTDPGRFEPPANMASLVAKAAMSPTGDELERWSAWVGAYGAPRWAVIDPTTSAARFLVDGDVPYVEIAEGGASLRHRLVEVEPEVFLADNGETLDLSGPVLRGQGVRLVRLTGGPALWQRLVLATAALVAVGWLIAALVRKLRRAGGPTVPAQRSPAVRWYRVAAAVAGCTAVLTVANVALLAWLPGLVDAGFLGWLRLSVVDRLAFHLPLALVVASGGTFVLTSLAWRGRWWSSAARWQHAVLAFAAATVVVQVAVWDLVGWGIR